jgi:DNA-binding NtrC family response regulator
MNISKKILVIEDDESSRESLVSYLEDKGYNVISTGDGYEGLELMKQENPALVITDNRLPNLEGIELACINESFKSKIPFIITSAYDNLQEYINKLNVIAFIQKPIDIKILDNYIKQVLIDS